MPKYRYTLLGIVGFILLCFTASLWAFYYEPLSIEALTKNADVILVGQCVNKQSEFVAGHFETRVTIKVTEYLKGNLDYWIHSTRQFLVVEAKKADMEKGFTQLAIELIAMDQYLDATSDFLYGAITIGDLWRFGTLDRQQKRILKDIDSFRVPLDLEELFQVLIGILKTEQK